MIKSIIINDGTSKAQLIKAIDNYEREYHVIVLKIEVNREHEYRLLEFDRTIVTEWRGFVDDFISGAEISKMQLANVLS